MPRIHRIKLAALCLLMAAVTAVAPAQEIDPGRAPTGKITNPSDLFKEPDGTEFRFSYFPSLDRLRLLVLHPPQQFTRWESMLRKTGQEGVLVRHEGPLPMPASGMTLPTPPLDEGTYEITLTLVTADGDRRDIKRMFQREHFPWENTSLGRDRVIVPPFTPLLVDSTRSSVACVLREHVLDSTGLWKQVSSQGRPLLTSPMRLEIESAGKKHVASSGSLAFTVEDADRVEGNSSWTAGTIEGRTEFEFDYDGLMKLTLHIQPHQQRIDSMQLVIPMKTSETWLMHPVTDYLRFHYAGRIPSGSGELWEAGGKTYDVRYTDTGHPEANGKVWDSRHVSRFQLPGPFVPYIWLGGTERGICWFAENDKDWSLDPNLPTMEIRKQGETTSLIVRLVTKPVTFTRPRTITFGLMATPAKPMPAAPVNYRRWWPGSPDPKTPDVVNFAFLGACYYWGSASPYHAFWPAYKNFSIYDEFARLRQGGAADPSFLKKWLAQFTPDDLRLAQDNPVAEKPDLATYRAHVNSTLGTFANTHTRSEIGQTYYVIPYTNARSVTSGKEVRTFMDEWSTCDIADPHWRWPGDERFLRKKPGDYLLATFGGKVVQPCQTIGIAFAIDPVPSWQDMVLSYIQRMLQTFSDGVYFDNCWLAANYNPLGPGYVDDEGKLHAGVNIFAFHDFIKRVAVMQHTMGRRPLIYMHMTGGNTVPLLSFGTMILDHEWRDQGEFAEQDAQERLGLDDDASMLLAQSTGLQSGCLGVFHDTFHGDERLSRSALGVALTHEMKYARPWWPAGDSAAAQLNGFGYGLPDCRVWRYWDQSRPIETTGAAVKTLILARSGKAMVVVASYGPAGEVLLKLDREALGLSGKVAGVDVENGQPVERLAPGEFKLTIPRHDFRIIQFQ